MSIRRARLGKVLLLSIWKTHGTKYLINFLNRQDEVSFIKDKDTHWVMKVYELSKYSRHDLIEEILDGKSRS